MWPLRDDYQPLNKRIFKSSLRHRHNHHHNHPLRHHPHCPDRHPVDLRTILTTYGLSTYLLNYLLCVSLHILLPILQDVFVN